MTIAGTRVGARYVPFSFALSPLPSPGGEGVWVTPENQMRLRITILSLLMLVCLSAVADDSAPSAKAIYDSATPSLVVVQYTWESEMGRRELTGAGVVVSADGVVVAPVGLFDLRIPDDQIKDVKILIPHRDRDNEEIDATFLARDERTNLAFVKASQPRTWTPMNFSDRPTEIGEAIFSVGMLPEGANYQTYLMHSKVAANLRGEIPQVLVSGGLAGIGSPVFNAAGDAIGIVHEQGDLRPFLNFGEETLTAVETPPVLFVPTRDFATSLDDPPTGPIKLPWIGTPQLTGLKKDVAEYFGLENVPAVEVGDVIPGSPADQAGLKPGMLIVKVNDEPLERGDLPEELPSILRRRITRMNVGDTVRFSVLTEKDQPLREIELTLAEQPPRAHLAKRFYAEDLGYTVRDLVFVDTYVRRLAAETEGVIVQFVRPQSAASSAQLQMNDLVTEINGSAVKDVEQFKREYEQFRKEKPKEAVVLVVLRDANTQVIRVEPPQ